MTFVWSNKIKQTVVAAPSIPSEIETVVIPTIVQESIPVPAEEVIEEVIHVVRGMPQEVVESLKNTEETVQEVVEELKNTEETVQEVVEELKNTEETVQEVIEEVIHVVRDPPQEVVEELKNAEETL